jgi:hypothetical protein
MTQRHTWQAIEMEQFLRAEYRSHKPCWPAAVLLAVYTVAHRKGLRCDLDRRVLAARLGESVWSLDQAKLHAIERGLLDYTDETLRDDDPRRKHATTARQFFPTERLRRVLYP